MLEGKAIRFDREASMILRSSCYRWYILARSRERKETRIVSFEEPLLARFVDRFTVLHASTVIEFTPGEGILDLLSFDNYHR